MTIIENKSSLSEAEKFLESLNLTQKGETDEVAADSTEIMSFLDELSNYPPAIDISSQKEKRKAKKKDVSVQNASSETSSWMSWGNSFWNQASAAVKTTTNQINLSVAGSEKLRVKTLKDLANKENMERLGTRLRSLTTTILDTVTPPISDHEFVEIWLSYKMTGYTGLESLVHRAFLRAMEYTEFGKVVVRNPDQIDSKLYHKKSLNIFTSLPDEIKLAKASLDDLLERYYKAGVQEQKTVYTPQAGAVPAIYCPLFMIIQPIKMSMQTIDIEDTEEQQLAFIILMADPTHNLKFSTYSQTIPLYWLDTSHEDSEWVEDKMMEIIRMAVTTIAQDYVWTRSPLEDV
ncbi:hypothetical protein G6F62_008995 [Rhizopus arrhizus]|nr:hypothetical protein G6F62_008995 [Rhizopus arrhizus]